MIAHEFYLERDFAAQYPGCEREPGLNRNITNVNGSGIGPGHPVGSTGDRSITTLICHEKAGENPGLATLCGGGWRFHGLCHRNHVTKKGKDGIEAGRILYG